MTELKKSRMMMERRENILQSQTAKITCNYIEYHKMTDQMFYGVPFTRISKNSVPDANITEPQSLTNAIP